MTEVVIGDIDFPIGSKYFSRLLDGIFVSPGSAGSYPRGKGYPCTRGYQEIVCVLLWMKLYLTFR